MHVRGRLVVPFALAVTGSMLVAGVAVAGSARSLHTVSFTAVPTHNADVSKRYEVETDKDNAQGKAIGSDVIVNTISSGARTSGYISFALAGGIINARFTANALSGALKGKITGGVGRYHGATGTVTAAGGSNGRERYTLKYRH